MPALGADMDFGTLVEWLKKPGDTLKRGDIIAVVETQKGAIEIEVFQDGVLKTLLAKPGEKLPVGAAMAIIDGGEEVAEAGAPAVPSAPLEPSRPKIVEAVRPQGRTPAGRVVRASPAARRRARELGIALAKLEGSVAGGAISIEDVERAARAAPPAPAPVAPSSSMRDVIGAAMARSKREIPHYYLSTAIDVEPALVWLEGENLQRPVPERILYGTLLLKAVALALREFPEMNGFFANGRHRPSAAIHLGVAISLRQGGLIAPAIHDADKLSLGTLMAALRDLVRRARAGGLRSSELADGTITVTSLGEQGVDAVFPVIYPPQVAIVGFGTVATRPWVVSGNVVPRRIVTASLGADHRASDGHRGGRFVARVAQLLQEPQQL